LTDFYTRRGGQKPDHWVLRVLHVVFTMHKLAPEHFIEIFVAGLALTLYMLFGRKIGSAVLMGNVVLFEYSWRISSG
jgi:hypothetical protein